MGKYLAAHINGRSREGKSILSPEGIKELHRPAVKLGDSAHYAMGWVIGKKLIGHDGSVPDFRSAVYFEPESHWGLVMLFNVNSEVASARLSGVARNAMRILMGEAVAPIRSGSFRTIFYALGIALCCQLAGILWTCFAGRQAFRRRERYPRLKGVAWQAGIQLTINLTLSVLVFVALPRVMDVPFFVGVMFAPDIGWLCISVGAIGLTWSAFLIYLVVRVCRMSKAESMLRVGSEGFVSPS
jgi:hypothetical protein